MEVIRVRNIHKYFGSLHVLRGIDLSISRGEIVSIIGPSGSGKSTLLRILNHLETADKGSICIEGDYVAKESASGHADYLPGKEVQRICGKLGMVFQNFNLFPHKSVVENLTEAPVTVRGLSKNEAEQNAIRLLEKVGLTEKRDNYPCHLSGGQQQRVAIARALAMDPDILLFDEPTSALDPELIGEVLRVIKNLASEQSTMIIVTHEMSFAREISDRILFMDEGLIVYDGAPGDFFENNDNDRIQAFLSKIIRHDTDGSLT